MLLALCNRAEEYGHAGSSECDPRAQASPNRSMTTRQYARLVSEWIGSVGLDPRLFGTHSLRASRSDRLRRTPWSWAYAAAKAGVRAMAASVSSLAMFSSRPACFLSR